MTDDDGGRRPTFSERRGFRPFEPIVQTESLDERTRMDLWNMFVVPKLLEARYMPVEQDVIWAVHLGKDRHHFGETPFYREMRRLVIEGEWYEILDLIEFVVQRTEDRTNLLEQVNFLFTLNRVGYRVIDTQVVPVTSTEEVASVLEAAHSPLESARRHIKRAVELHSVRDNPNYAKVIHEAMSAAEAAAQALAGRDNGTLAEALSAVQRGSTNPLHPALIEGWKRIYGYTSDSGGIRHALRDGTSDPDQPIAQYFLITCSAFVNLVASILAN
ncbi:MAG: hypothetical protein PGN27_25100 [Mycolicibacterium neoaurum]|uniref:AbiJ-NTD4 domain-containing protein n=1 Tax=Mycolicibacterium neoaurum TaxID=1795 RepID=UPI002FFD18CB